MNTKELQTVTSLGDNITIIAITGGPCSGKTTGLAKLVDTLGNKGYKVLVSPESATKLITAGIHPWELHGSVFQRQILLDTLAQEERFIEAAKAYRDMGRKVVILCDRGCMDGEAYMPKEAFGELVKTNGLSLHDICESRYHAVIHLQTAAMGAEEFYTLENNSARKETPAEARELDRKTLEAWQRHHHPRLVDNSTGFDGKIQRLLGEVADILGDPVPIEKEEKFLIESFDPATVPVHATTTEIIQTYLMEENEGEERRLRARSDGQSTSYFYTVKRHIRKGERYEVERMVSRREYDWLLEAKDLSTRTIKKRRTCFFHDGQFVEIDVFDAPEESRGLVVMEIEQSTMQRELVLPPFVNVVRNVTGEKRYSNRALATAV